MSLAKLINQALGHFGVALVRKQTFDSLVSEPHHSRQAESAEADCHVDGRYTDLLRHQIGIKWRLIDFIEQNGAPPTDLCCPLCGYLDRPNAFREFVSNCAFEGGILIRHQCPRCDVIFGAQKMLRLSANDLAKEYEWHYQAFSEVDSTEQELKAFHKLGPRRDGIYLNWGAGSWSRTIGLLRAEGWNVYGYEPHASFATNTPFVITSHEELSRMTFDGIFSNNVLEHLRYPVHDLSEMAKLLNRGGKMSHATPCFAYLYEYTRFHLFFFLGRSRELLANKAGLRIDEFFVDGEFMALTLAEA